MLGPACIEYDFLVTDVSTKRSAVNNCNTMSCRQSRDAVTKVFQYSIMCPILENTIFAFCLSESLYLTSLGISTGGIKLSGT